MLTSGDLKARLAHTDFPVLLIAELGINHNADHKLACDMMQAAMDNGATGVKLQSYTTDLFINKDAKDVSGLIDIFKQFELSFGAHEKCVDFAIRNNIPLFSTILTDDYLQFWSQAGCNVAKVASGDLDNALLHLNLMEKGFETIVSTGANDLETVKKTLRLYQSQGHIPVAFLHCVSLYPTLIDKVNLKRIHFLTEVTGIQAGFSDHTLGVNAAFGSVIAGARIIEKHFTLDKNMPGPDQKLSSDPRTFKRLRRAIEKALVISGDGEQPYEEELQSDYYGKRSLYSFQNKLISQRPRQNAQPSVNKLSNIINPS